MSEKFESKTPSDAATCADNIEGDGPTDEERAANWRELHKLSRANRFRLMFGQPMLPDEATETSQYGNQP